jgi:hypothetical protein
MKLVETKPAPPVAEAPAGPVETTSKAPETGSISAPAADPIKP